MEQPIREPRVHAGTPASAVRAAALAAAVLVSACGPSPSPAPPPPDPAPTPRAPGKSVVSIPEEFSSPPPEATPVPPVLPKILFVKMRFQVTTSRGIQGISAGEVVNLVSKQGDEYIVKYGDLQFRKHKSFFSDTYVETADIPRKIDTPEAVDPRLPDEPAEAHDAASEASVDNEQAEIARLTDSIRDLNDKIRTEQEALDRRSAGAKSPDSIPELKKSARAIQRLKDKRNELSRQLTEIGKP